MERVWLARYPQGTPAEVSLDAGTTLVDVFRRSCERFAARPAFHNMGTTLSYAEVDQLSRDFAAWRCSAHCARGWWS
jgi:long-chain acyl-CoA synthetase